MKLKRPKGTRDILPSEMVKRRYVEGIMRQTFELYNYREVETPIFEYFDLFAKKSGEEIRKSMYVFKDKSGRKLALRPELTAPTIRLYVEELQAEPKPIKLYYIGPCFRYEQPQAGRWRQFWHAGVELIGGGAEADAEVIALTTDILNRVGLQNYEVRIGDLTILRSLLQEAEIVGDEQNKILSLIDKGEREDLLKALNKLKLDPEHQQLLLGLLKLRGKPQKILQETQKLLGEKMAEKDLRYLMGVLDVLELLGVKNYEIDLGIARGLDYYTGLVFEIDAPALGAQSQICGGGSYELIKVFGGEPLASRGFSFGFDRVITALEKEGYRFPPPRKAQVLVAPTSENVRKAAISVAQGLRQANVSTEIDLMSRKLSSILSYADSTGISYVVIVGLKELKEEKVVLRDMHIGSQQEVKIEKLPELLAS